MSRILAGTGVLLMVLGSQAVTIDFEGLSQADANNYTFTQYGATFDVQSVVTNGTVTTEGWKDTEIGNDALFMASTGLFADANNTYFQLTLASGPSAETAFNMQSIKIGNGTYGSRSGTVVGYLEGGGTVTYDFTIAKLTEVTYDLTVAGFNGLTGFAILPQDRMATNQRYSIDDMELTFGTVDPGTVPEAPTDFSATSAGFFEIDLSWTDVATNEFGYKIERSQDGSTGWTNVVTVGADSTSATDTGLADNTTYYYRIYGFNLVGNSATVGVVNATTDDQIPPGSPISLMITGVGFFNVDLEFEDTADNETGFIVESSPDGVSSWTVAATRGAHTDPTNSIAGVTVSGLSDATTYWFRVAATNETEQSQFYSNIVSTNTLDQVAPADPGGLFATGVGPSVMELAWTDNSDNETGFEIERKLTGTPDAFELIHTTAAGIQSYTDTGLQPETGYTYRVRAVNETEQSDYTAEALGTTLSTLGFKDNIVVFDFTTTSEVDEANTLWTNTLSLADKVMPFGSGSIGFTPGPGFGSLESSSNWGIIGLNATNLAMSIASNEYMTFTIDLESGFMMDLSALELVLDPKTYITGGTGNGVTDAALFIDAVGAFIDGNELAIWDNNSSGNKPMVFAITNVAAVAELAGPIEIRVYCWNARATVPLTGGGGWTFSGDPVLPGTLTLTGIINSDDPYLGWASDYGLTGVKTNDSDGDSVSDFYEYALGGDPTNQFDSGMVAFGDNGAGGFVYIYAERTDNLDLVYTLEHTASLIAPQWTNTGFTVTAGPSGTLDFTSVTNVLDTTGIDEQFIRLTIE